MPDMSTDHDRLRAATVAPASAAPAIGSDLLGAMLAELGSTASPGQAHGFLVAVGRRFATTAPMPDDATLPALQQAINMIWRSAGAGRAELTAADDAILIRHHLPASRTPLTDGHPSPIVSIAEGAYQRWFEMLGDAAGLALSIIAATPSAIDYRYGR